MWGCDVPYYLPINTIQHTPTPPPLTPVLQCCSGWRHTLFIRATWGRRGHSHFPFVKLNFMSHSDSERLLPAHTKKKTSTTSHPPPIQHLPLALSLILHLPTSHSAAFWMQIKLHGGGRKKAKKGFVLVRHQTNVCYRRKKKYNLFFLSSNIYIFEGSRHCQHACAGRQITAGWGDRGDGYVLGL